ncbi:MAG TPA: hypothetical protein VGE62_01805 [Candidatus Paceibacterota bacterium]
MNAIESPLHCTLRDFLLRALGGSLLPTVPVEIPDSLMVAPELCLEETVFIQSESLLRMTSEQLVQILDLYYAETEMSLENPQVSIMGIISAEVQAPEFQPVELTAQVVRENGQSFPILFLRVRTAID